MTPPMRCQTPLMVSKEVLKLLSAVVPQPKPFFLAVTPQSWAKPLECFSNVDQAIHHNSGTKQMGWLVHVWPRVLVELQDHAIWIQDDGTPLDITPALPHAPGAAPETVQLFLPDPARTTDANCSTTLQIAFRGHPLNERIASTRMAINHAFRSDNETEVNRLAEVLKDLERRRAWAPERNDPCPCGSRRKLKACHGQ